MASAITRIGPKHQITIPREVFKKLRLAIGEYLEVGVEDNRIFLTPKKLIPKDQEWFYTPEWQTKEAEADRAIAAGEISEAFSSADDLISYLKKQGSRKSKA